MLRISSRGSVSQSSLFPSVLFGKIVLKVGLCFWQKDAGLGGTELFIYFLLTLLG